MGVEELEDERRGEVEDKGLCAWWGEGDQSGYQALRTNKGAGADVYVRCDDEVQMRRRTLHTLFFADAC